MKILSLNTWGAPYAKHRAVRRALISDEIKRLNPNIILLQEVYLPDCPSDFIKRLSKEWQHYHYFDSALVGSGLLTLSRYPILETKFAPFRLAGKPEKINHGDFYAGKGIGLTRLDTPEGVLDVYNTHTHAQYDYKNKDNEYAVFNETNCYDAAKFIWEQSGTQNPVVLAGDFNTRPDQRGYDILTQLGQLGDAYPAVHGKHDFTFSKDNPYSQHDNQILDYVMGRKVIVKDIRLVMTEYFDYGAKAYSDHFGLLADVQITDIVPPSQGDKLEHIMTQLSKRLDVAIGETENAVMKRYERAAMGVFGLVDLAVTSSIIGKWNEQIAKFVRRLGIVLALLFAVYQVMQAQLNVKTRRDTMQEIYDEVQVQLEAGQIFDGRHLGD